MKNALLTSFTGFRRESQRNVRHYLDPSHGVSRHSWQTRAFRYSFEMIKGKRNSEVLARVASNASNVRFTSTSRWKSKRSILCQLDPSSANTFQALLTCAHRHSDTTSRYEKILPMVRQMLRSHTVFPLWLLFFRGGREKKTYDNYQKKKKKKRKKK